MTLSIEKGKNLMLSDMKMMNRIASIALIMILAAYATAHAGQPRSLVPA
jgi:hypothetical protein